MTYLYYVFWSTESKVYNQTCSKNRLEKCLFRSVSECKNQFHENNLEQMWIASWDSLIDSVLIENSFITNANSCQTDDSRFSWKIHILVDPNYELDLQIDLFPVLKWLISVWKRNTSCICRSWRVLDTTSRLSVHGNIRNWFSAWISTLNDQIRRKCIF